MTQTGIDCQNSFYYWFFILIVDYDTKKALKSLKLIFWSY